MDANELLVLDTWTGWPIRELAPTAILPEAWPEAEHITGYVARFFVDHRGRGRAWHDVASRTVFGRMIVL